MRKLWVPKRGAALSAQEKQIFRLIGQANYPADIARTLHMNLKTVQSICCRLKLKLGVSSLEQLLRKAVLEQLNARVVMREVNKPLTPREVHLLGMLGGGKSPKEICRQLRRSPKTGQKLFERAKLKLGTQHFRELVRIAVLWREGKLVFRKQYEWRYGVRSASQNRPKSSRSDF